MKGKSKKVKVKSSAGIALGDKTWAVIGDHYVNTDLTYDEARAEVAQLRAKKQPGLVVVTNATAERMVQGAAGIGMPSLPDTKF